MSFAVWFRVHIGKSRCLPGSAVWAKEENKCTSVCFTVLTHNLPTLYMAEAGPRRGLGEVLSYHYSYCFLLEASRLSQMEPTKGLLEPRALTEKTLPTGRSTLLCLLF